jgi:hypothetical protein
LGPAFFKKEEVSQTKPKTINGKEIFRDRSLQNLVWKKYHYRMTLLSVAAK